MTGVCGDTRRLDGMPTAEQLRAVGADGVRVQAEPGNADHAWHYVNTLAHAGFRTAVVLDADAFPDEDRAGWSEWHALNYQADLFIIGNEPDGSLLPGSDESWSMQPEEYRDLFMVCEPAIRRACPDAKVLIGGLVSGQPDFLGLLLPLHADGVDAHPYSKSAEPARLLLRAYKDYGLPIYVMEWHRPAGEIAEFSAMLLEETEWACWFCWHPYLGMGLINEAGDPTPAYHGFKQLGGTMTAIDDRAKQLGAKLGPALTEEQQVLIQVGLRAYENGLLIDVPGAGVYAVAEATVADKFR